MPSRTWETLNDLEMTTAKICSAREIIDAAVDAIQHHQNDKAETLMTAAYEFLEYYLNEFDEKFKLAWQETVVKQKEKDDDLYAAAIKEKEYYESGRWNSFWNDKDLVTGHNYQGSTVNSVKVDDCMPPWGHSDMEALKYTDEELNAMCDAAKKEDKVKKWVLPVELEPSGECFVTFPDDLLEVANLEEGDQVEWIDQGDGSYLLKKVVK